MTSRVMTEVIYCKKSLLGPLRNSHTVVNCCPKMNDFICGLDTACEGNTVHIISWLTILQPRVVTMKTDIVTDQVADQKSSCTVHLFDLNDVAQLRTLYFFRLAKDKIPNLLKGLNITTPAELIAYLDKKTK